MLRPMISMAMKPQTSDSDADDAEIGRADLRLADAAEPARVERPQRRAASRRGCSGSPVFERAVQLDRRCRACESVPCPSPYQPKSPLGPQIGMFSHQFHQ